MQNGEGFLLPLVTNRKTPAHEIWGSFKVHVHFTCIFLSFLGLPAVWSVSVSGCFYFHCPVAVLSKVVELAGVEPASEISTFLMYYQENNNLRYLSIIYMAMVDNDLHW